MSAGDLTRRTVGGLLWTGGGKAAYGLLYLSVLAILARMLSPAEFGVVSAALVVIGVSQIVSQLGLGPALVQRPELEPRHVDTAFSASIAIGLVLGALVWAAAPAAAGFLRVPAAAPDLVLAASRYGYLYRSDDGGDSWRKLWRELGEVSSVLWAGRD